MANNKYQAAKEKVRHEAMAWQNDFSNNNYSYEEIAHFTTHFEQLGKKYGLLREFRENGIC